MSMQKVIYEKSPIPVQNVLLSGVGYQKNRSRYGKAYYNHRKFLEQFDHYTLEEQLDYQRKELIRFLQFTYEHSPFYRDLYKDVDLTSIQSVEDLKQLPIVDKELLRQHMDQVTTVSRKEAVVHHTSGSTGKPFEVFLTKEDMMKRSAQLDHFKARVGFENLKMRKASFNGHVIVPPTQKKNVYWRYNRAAKQMMYSTYDIKEETIPYYIEHLNRFRPKAIDGYFSSMVLIANYMERHNLSFDFIPIGLFPTAETVNPSGKMLLERVFQAKVYDQYASSEGAPFITECSHQRLHMELSSGVFEHIEEGSDEVLVTSFTTHGTPLIRYRIRDAVTFEDRGVQCACGSEAPLVKTIKGRTLDYLLTVDGRKLYITHILGTLENVPGGIIQSQFIQERLDEVRLLLQKDPKTFKEDFIHIIKRDFYDMFGRETRLAIEYVEDIPKEKNGKYRIIKNKLITR